MARFLLIADATNTPKDNRMNGDIVGVFDDTHGFTEKEKGMFSVRDTLDNAVTVRAAISEIETTLFRAAIIDWTTDLPEEVQGWRDENGNWFEIKNRPRFTHRLEDGKVKENFSLYPENKEHLLISVEA